MRSPQETLSRSLLDRLTDLEPDKQTEPATTEWEDLRDLKASLCRDVAALLNTRRKEEVVPAGYEDANNSVLTYGIADFTSYNLTNSIEQELVRRSIERAIRQFEPRLTRVTVNVEEPNSSKPTLRFQMEAVLKDAEGEEVAFDVSLHRDSRRVTVAGAER